MTAQMLSAYYNRNCNSLSLFQNLEISKDESFEKHLNSYDVFFINMQQFLSDTDSPMELVEFLQSELLKELHEV